MDELEPCHVELGCCGTAPLTSFEEDEAYGLISYSELFEAFDETALRAGEAEEDVLTASFIFNPYEEGSPEWEIVAGTETDESVDNFETIVGGEGGGNLCCNEGIEICMGNEGLDERDSEHRDRNPLDRDRESFYLDTDSISDRAFAGDGIKRGGITSDPTGVFGDYFEDFGL